MVVGIELCSVCGVFARMCCVGVLDFYERSVGMRYACAVLCGTEALVGNGMGVLSFFLCLSLVCV